MSNQGPYDPQEGHPQGGQQPPPQGGQQDGGWGAPNPQWGQGQAPPPYGQNPQYGGGYQQPPTIPDYLVWAILETVFCCLPLGIAGIVYASRATSKKNMGDYNGAYHDAQTAKKVILIGAIIGAVLVVGWMVLAVIGAAVGDSSDA